jgi:hypothetical protein
MEERKTYAVVPGNYPHHIIQAMEARGNWRQISEDIAVEEADFFWRPYNFGPYGYNRISKRTTLKPTFIFNHFENLAGVCTKTGLVRSLFRYYETNTSAKTEGYGAFDSTPTSFVISDKKDDKEMVAFMQRYRELSRGGSQNERMPHKHCARNIWLVKPADENQGRGIEVYEAIKDIQDHINYKRGCFWVIQKYIERPLLFKGRKFDIRVWALVTETFQIHFYREGYLRTSSAEYNSQEKNNLVHLTNQCLQVHGSEYGKHEEGNVLSFTQFQEYMDTNQMKAADGSKYRLDVQEMVVPRMKDLIIDAFLSVRNSLNPKKRANVFELFGFDFVIDEDYRTWLIEVNTCPDLNTPNKYM